MRVAGYPELGVIILTGILLLFTGRPGYSQNIPPDSQIKTEMDWFLTRLGITLVQGIELPGGNLSPSSHPRALRKLERKLPIFVQRELVSLPWNHLGSLGDLSTTDFQTREIMEMLSGSIQRLWSRLSLDGRTIEARYSLDIATILKARKEVSVPDDTLLPPIPLGWTPTPRDPWTGLIIYVPLTLPIHGEEGRIALNRVVYPRILSEDMEVLANISPRGDFVIPYLTLQEREQAREIVGGAPYRTMARSVRNLCDIVISMEDSRRLLGSESGRNLLLEGRIVILLETSP